MARATKPAELRLKTEDERDSLLLDLKKEQFNLRFQRAVGQTEGAARVREVRREIARLKTVRHMDKLAAAAAGRKAAAAAAAKA